MKHAKQQNKRIDFPIYCEPSVEDVKQNIQILEDEESALWKAQDILIAKKNSREIDQDDFMTTLDFLQKSIMEKSDNCQVLRSILALSSPKELKSFVEDHVFSSINLKSYKGLHKLLNSTRYYSEYSEIYHKTVAIINDCEEYRSLKAAIRFLEGITEYKGLQQVKSWSHLEDLINEERLIIAYYWSIHTSGKQAVLTIS